MAGFGAQRRLVRWDHWRERAAAKREASRVESNDRGRAERIRLRAVSTKQTKRNVTIRKRQPTQLDLTAAPVKLLALSKEWTAEKTNERTILSLYSSVFVFK